jgi:hypothetical protein
MIIVSVHLKSAISRARDKELARFVILGSQIVGVTVSSTFPNHGTFRYEER